MTQKKKKSFYAFIVNNKILLYLYTCIATTGQLKISERLSRLVPALNGMRPYLLNQSSE